MSTRIPAAAAVGIAAILENHVAKLNENKRDADRKWNLYERKRGKTSQFYAVFPGYVKAEASKNQICRLKAVWGTPFPSRHNYNIPFITADQACNYRTEDTEREARKQEEMEARRKKAIKKGFTANSINFLLSGTGVSGSSFITKPDGTETDYDGPETAFPVCPHDVPALTPAFMRRFPNQEQHQERQQQQDGPLQVTSGPQEQTHGDYINTRLEEIQKMLGIQDCDAQERKKLEEERHSLVEEGMRKVPGFRPPTNYEKPSKFSDKLYIPMNKYSEGTLIDKLIGPGKTTLKRIESGAGAKIFIRGKGSVKKHLNSTDGAPLAGEDDDLHFLVIANSEAQLRRAMMEIRKVIETAVNVGEGQNAESNEKNDGDRICTTCGSNAHSQFDCPERETEKEVGELGFNVSGAVSHVGKGADCTKPGRRESFNVGQEQALDNAPGPYSNPQGAIDTGGHDSEDCEVETVGHAVFVLPELEDTLMPFTTEQARLFVLTITGEHYTVCLYAHWMPQYMQTGTFPGNVSRVVMIHFRDSEDLGAKIAGFEELIRDDPSITTIVPIFIGNSGAPLVTMLVQLQDVQAAVVWHSSGRVYTSTDVITMSGGGDEEEGHGIGEGFDFVDWDGGGVKE